ncbi:MAG: pyridoxal phosphate-dependent aminotransferase family protein [Alphaproteobacteria bacterium]|nr:pyridoxal phosphate-dependent aminotransferase family protein [Alphaproteobacteria bacterium]
MTRYGQSPQMQRLEKFVARVREQGLYPDIPVVESAATEPVVRIEGKDLLLFCSNNLLGMSSHGEVKAAAAAAVEKYGLGSGGSRVMAANLDVHVRLEQRIAEFLGREDAICFAAGYMANVGTIPALMRIDFLASLNLNDMALNFTGKRRKVESQVDWDLFSEEANHASDVDGVRLSRAEPHIYGHKDMVGLGAALAASRHHSKIVISDGVFSMDGDIAPIPEIVALAKSHQAMVMVDDAHGIGVLGAKGRGSLEHLGVASDDVDILMGTFTKAFGGIGGFVAGSTALIDYLRISARTYIFSAPIPPAIAAGLITSIDIVDREPWRHEKALENAAYFRRKVEAAGFDTLGSETHIVPVLIGREDAAVRMAEGLRGHGIIAPKVHYPAVPVGRSRIRFVMTCQHNQAQIDYLLRSLRGLKTELNL